MYVAACERSIHEDGKWMFVAVAWGWAADSRRESVIWAVLAIQWRRNEQGLPAAGASMC